MTQLYAPTEVRRSMMQHYMPSVSCSTVYATRCQAKILSADNKTKMPYLADEVATVRYVGNKALQKISFRYIFISDRLNNLEIVEICNGIRDTSAKTSHWFKLPSCLDSRKVSRNIIYHLQISCSHSTAHNFHSFSRGMSQNGKVQHCRTKSSCPQYSSPSV